MTKLWTNCMSVMLSLVLGAFSCAALAGNPGAASGSATIVAAVTQDEVQQAGGGQDPNSPPDCKKYPNDTRCKK